MIDEERKAGISVREARVSDAAALRAIYAFYVEHTAISFEYAAPTREEFEARIAHTLTRYPYLAAERGGKVIGYACAGTFKNRAAYDWAVETTVYVARDARKCGAGRLLYQELENRLRRQHVTNANACITVPVGDDPYLTRDSLRFHERMGYRLVGEFHRCGYKFGRWYNMAWMEKMLSAHPAAPGRFIPYSELPEEGDGNV